MRILITGATGYFGSHLTCSLVARGHTVAALKRRTSRMERLERVKERLVCHDMEDEPAVFLREWMPDVLIHAATCYDRRGEGLHAVFQSNVEMPMRLMAAACEARVPLFVNTDTTLPPELNAYALSKRQMADWARYIAEEGSIRVLNVRLESVFGPGDDQSKFPTQIIRSMLKNEPEFAMSPGGQSRDFIHIDDAVDAYVLLMEYAARSNTPCIESDLGSGRPVTIREFAELAAEICRSATRLRFGAKEYRPGELMFTRANVDLLTHIGWQGARDLRTSLEMTIAEERKLL